MFGRKATFPTSVYERRDQEISYNNYACEMKKCFARMHATARANLILSKQKRKEIYDRTSKDWIPMWGEQVLVQANPMGVGQKLQNLWRGPYEIVDLPSDQTAVVKNGNKLEKVHLNRLRRYY